MGTRRWLASALLAMGIGACKRGPVEQQTSPPPPASAPANAAPPVPPQGAAALLEDAATKATRGDGQGCLAALDRHDAANPARSSRKIELGSSQLRARCLMQAGQCREGKKLLHAGMMYLYENKYGRDHVETMVESVHATACTGDDLDDRDRLLRAITALERGAYVKAETVPFCDRHLATVDQLIGKVRPRNAEDRKIADLRRRVAPGAAGCYVKAGSCAHGLAAFKRFGGGMPEDIGPELLRVAFMTLHETCEGRV